MRTTCVARLFGLGAVYFSLTFPLRAQDCDLLAAEFEARQGAYVEILFQQQVFEAEANVIDRFQTDLGDPTFKRQRLRDLIRAIDAAEADGAQAKARQDSAYEEWSNACG